jgi:hypothetical protein
MLKAFAERIGYSLLLIAGFIPALDIILKMTIRGLIKIKSS